MTVSARAAHTHTKYPVRIPVRSVVYWLERIRPVVQMDPELLQRWEVTWTVLTLGGNPVLYEDRDWVVATSGQEHEPYVKLQLWKQGKRYGRSLMLRIAANDVGLATKALGLLGIGWQEAGSRADWWPAYMLLIRNGLF